jgi:predicted transcriptional regulator
MEISKDFEEILSDNGLLKINENLKLEVTEKGKIIQDKMGLHTKIMKNIKLEGKQANDLLEMLDEL